MSECEDSRLSTKTCITIPLKQNEKRSSSIIKLGIINIDPDIKTKINENYISPEIISRNSSVFNEAILHNNYIVNYCLAKARSGSHHGSFTLRRSSSSVLDDFDYSESDGSQGHVSMDSGSQPSELMKLFTYHLDSSSEDLDDEDDNNNEEEVEEDEDVAQLNNISYNLKKTKVQKCNCINENSQYKLSHRRAKSPDIVIMNCINSPSLFNYILNLIIHLLLLKIRKSKFISLTCLELLKKLHPWINRRCIRLSSFATKLYQDVKHYQQHLGCIPKVMLAKFITLFWSAYKQAQMISSSSNNGNILFLKCNRYHPFIVYKKYITKLKKRQEYRLSTTSSSSIHPAALLLNDIYQDSLYQQIQQNYSCKLYFSSQPFSRNISIEILIGNLNSNLENIHKDIVLLVNKFCLVICEECDIVVCYIRAMQFLPLLKTPLNLIKEISHDLPYGYFNEVSKWLKKL